jgi:hypothetical protein
MQRTFDDFYIEKEGDLPIEILSKKEIQRYKTRIIKI